MDIGELTQDEISLVLAAREAKVKDVAIASLKRHAFDVASKYRDWLRENGAGDTFSTFVDEFGYEDLPSDLTNYVRRDAFWKIVKALIDTVDAVTQRYFE